ncbi:hypothetical protein M409DRAFT_21649 [Zasmidium cellare ATCC 36951]|uniref:ATPase expression protein 2, mitochondrial n=1 Tax=Zasmidium cellare ATCC 36951 TaxID=1080233 RepID=A0A6A6CM32_ZASCE|nr:uncharacterized protein M409DRAFT_21649 [Zasmidium cellare ATCC 36951]KAF2168205.1 hypothetical protein M409DRAFT_21649 [Zasmidium cellare ATCC 36951]
MERTTEPTGPSRSETSREDMWEQFEVSENEGVQQDGITAPQDTTYVQDEHELDLLRNQALLKLDYKAELSGALLRAETDRVMRCLFAANHANDIDWIRSIPPTTFSEIIRMVQPKKFTSTLGSAHVELSTWMVKHMGIAPMRQIAFEYASVIRQLLGIRKYAGIKLTLGDYMVLLRAARDLGNQRMGRLLWSNLLEEGYKPTTQCYNYMMETVVWNGIHNTGGRQKVRIVPFNMLGRQKQTKPRFHGYSVGPGGVRQTVMSIFNEMLANEAYADVYSFRIIMTASAREGDLQTVKSILMKVWNIDVDGIMAGKPESEILPKQRPEHSPLRPTKSLLFTLAHIFGINNDIPTALRVVDFVARHYNLQVDEQSWSQLFEWTFVLATDRLNAARRMGTDVGHLPHQSLLNLWDTMVSPPYNFEPTMGMYNYLIKHLFRFRWVPDMATKLEEGRELYVRHRRLASLAYHQLKMAVERQSHTAHAQQPDETLERLRNRYEKADLIRQRNIFWLKRWVRLFLGVHNHHVKNDHRFESAARTLPALLWTFRHEAPSRIKYEIQTGLVEIEFRTEQQITLNLQRRFDRQAGTQKILDASRKLVGQRWVRGGVVKKAKRLQEHEQKLEVDSFSSNVEINE